MQPYVPPPPFTVRRPGAFFSSAPSAARMEENQQSQIQEVPTAAAAPKRGGMRMWDQGATAIDKHQHLTNSRKLRERLLNSLA